MADTTIESTKYNANVADVETDLNAPRPIIAGGTGANNAVDAAINLGVVSGKTVITYTEAEKAVARNNIAAAPMDALAYNGMQINGSMEVSQEKGTAVTTTQGYIIDGWAFYNSGTMAVSAGQIALATGNVLSITTTTAQPVLGANDYLVVGQTIEGYRIQRLLWGTSNASPITISFFSAHSRTGLYSVAIRNGAFNRAYVATYTQNTAGVYQQNVITIPGETTGAGAWDKTTGAGIRLDFSVASGSAAITSPNAWIVGSFTAAAGQTNGVAGVSDVFRISNVIVLPGTQAPAAAQSPLIMRPYDQELATCKRYWQKLGGEIIGDVFLGGYCSGGGQLVAGTISYPVEMRALPTAAIVGVWNSTAGNLSSSTVLAGRKSLGLQLVSAAAGPLFVHTNSADDCITLDARL